jgi:hypothetical protein
MRIFFFYYSVIWLKKDLVNKAEAMHEYCRINGFTKWFESSPKENINIETSF